MACAICETRRPRRYCPGVRGDICSICCGTEREVSVECPFECEYLLEARRHEKLGLLDPSLIPNQDIKVTEKFVGEREPLMIFLAQAAAMTALETPGAIDFDVRETLESLVQTYRTLQSGVHYESIPQNPLAANMFRGIQAAIAEFRRQEQERGGMIRTRDADILGMLVFLQRLEYDHNNGRRRGRAFIHAMCGFLYSGKPETEPPASSLIIP